MKFTKACSVCKEEKPLTAFYNYKAAFDGKSYRCKACDNLARTKWTENNPESARKSRRGRRLKFRYGITLDDYRALLEKQNYSCAICGSTHNKVAYDYTSFSVDHDHDTGKVRGLLCNQCNRGLGMLGDTLEALKKAVDYLSK